VIPHLRVTDLNPEAFRHAAVWEYTNDDSARDGELLVRPVLKRRVRDTRNRVIGTEARLADGTILPAMVGNVDQSDPVATQHFLPLSVWTGRRWFHLARYHDVERKTNGPGALSAALGRRVAEVFPVAYDLTSVVSGDPAVLRGKIEAKPSTRLSRAELIALAVTSEHERAHGRRSRPAVQRVAVADKRES
jgi:hypothetical protein